MEAPYVPSVEDRFVQIEQTLALHMMLARGLSAGTDLGLTDEDQSAAWSECDRALTEALAGLRAVKRVMSGAVQNLGAPDADEAGGGR